VRTFCNDFLHKSKIEAVSINNRQAAAVHQNLRFIKHVTKTGDCQFI